MLLAMDLRLYRSRCRVGLCFFPAGLAVARNAPATATAAMRMLSPATRHAEFIPPEPATAEGAQDQFHLSAEMRFDPYAPPFQRLEQRFGHRGAEQHVDLQLRHTPRQFFRRQQAENEFLSFHFLPASAGHQKQSRRRVEHRRDALLRDGNGNRHVSRNAMSVPVSENGRIRLLWLQIAALRLSRFPTGHPESVAGCHDDTSTAWRNATTCELRTA